jgi:hypothetical protein
MIVNAFVVFPVAFVRIAISFQNHYYVRKLPRFIVLSRDNYFLLTNFFQYLSIGILL